MTSQHPIVWLEEWYRKQCNDQWEHSYGITVNTIDNPGWEIAIDLENTSLHGCEMEKIIIERSESDWIRCKVLNNKFLGYGGAKNLSEILTVFKEWTVKIENEN